MGLYVTSVASGVTSKTMCFNMPTSRNLVCYCNQIFIITVLVKIKSNSCYITFCLGLKRKGNTIINMCHNQ